MLKAYSRLLEQLMLVVDLVLVGLCWLLAYWLRCTTVAASSPSPTTTANRWL